MSTHHTKASELFLLTLASAVLAALPVSAQDGWIDLFNGKNLDGWAEHSGRAKYTVEDGVLTGQSVSDSGNSFLCTTQTFGNFELELEYKCDALLNSGVQIRSEVFPDAMTSIIDGKEFKFAPDRVHGYQVEIDMDAARGRMWSGGIYDEARRGWLFPADGEKGRQGLAFSEQGRAASKNGEWNKLRIVASGPSIKTWLNGEPRAEITDSLTPRGIIALQVHGVGNAANKIGLKVSFRNIRLHEIKPENNFLTGQEKADGWKLLWDGKTTDGWRGAKADGFPADGWSIKDGELTAMANGGTMANADIITRERYSNFELAADFKVTPGAKGAIKYLAQPAAPGAASPAATTLGLQFQILDDEFNPDAKLGHDGNRTLASLYDIMPAAASKKPNAVGEWNTARIVVRGQHVEHWLNGAKVLEFERGSPEFRAAVARSKYQDAPGFGEWPDGPVLLQQHGFEVSFRNIKLREIKSENNTLTAPEKAGGWKLLWDGKTTDGWRSPNANEFPGKSWIIADGEFRIVSSGNGESQAGGDIITRDRYSNFELVADFKTTAGCNSGIKIFVQPDISPVDKATGKPAAVGSAIGMEFQILDDEHHPDAKLGKNGDRKLGSLYDLIPAPANKIVLPVGEWNHARIVSQGRHVEFWLNGEKTVGFERGSPEFRAAVAESKFKNIPDFGEWPDGHVLLQEHGSVVSFRNVKIRELPAN